MKPENAFVADRAIARHCPELLREGPAPVELLPALAREGQRLARALGAALAPVCGGEAPVVRAAAPRECAAADLAATIAPLAANTLFDAGSRALPLLASIEAEGVLRLVDRAFGGSGQAPAKMPEAFPLSAELMIARLEGIVATALASGLGAGISPARRDGSLAVLAPFAPTEQVTVLALTVEEAGRAGWTVTIALPLPTLADLLGDAAPARPAPARTGAADPQAEPFADLPLTLAAVLVDMRISVSALSALQPGQIIPVAVARSVPLRVGDATVAHGTIGALDDRVAVQVTHAF